MEQNASQSTLFKGTCFQKQLPKKTGHFVIFPSNDRPADLFRSPVAHVSVSGGPWVWSLVSWCAPLWRAPPRWCKRSTRTVPRECSKPCWTGGPSGGPWLPVPVLGLLGKKWKKREIYGMSWNIKGYKIEGSPSLTCFFMFKPWSDVRYIQHKHP